MKGKVKRIKRVARRRKTRLQAMSSSTWLDGDRLVEASPTWLDDDRLVEGDPLRNSMLKRLAPAVRHLVNVSTEHQLLEALSTTTSIDALIHLVSGDTTAVEVASKVEDPLREAKARAARKFSELLAAEGGPIRVEEVSKRLRITRAAVDKRRKNGTLIGIEDGGRGILYPGWQFTGTGLLPGLDDALRVIGVSDPWMRMQFFLTPDIELGTRPLDALRNGRVEEVVRAARRFGRFGEDG